MIIEKNDQTKDRKRANPTDYLANERTFLAWIRTSIAIMAFGFVVVKFGLFNKQIALMTGETVFLPTRDYSGITGILLVSFGVVITVLAYIRFKQVNRQLKEGMYRSAFRISFLLTFMIVLVGLVLVFYLAQ